MNKEFVPKDYIVPTSLKSEQFQLQILSPKVGEIDYEAVMSSKIRLRNVFGSSTEWPSENLTLEDNINDLTRHQKEFEHREAFAYTVLDLSGERCLGCVYIEPSDKSTFDCVVYLWVRDSHIKLDSDLFAIIKNWIKTSWPFEKVIFPGRDISWDKWNEIE